VDRRCEQLKSEAKEECALGGNPVAGRGIVLDMYHLRIDLGLGQTVSGCGRVRFIAKLSAPGSAPRVASAEVECAHACMPDGPGGGVCWDPPHQELSFELELREPLPHFRSDGTSAAGEFLVQVTSEGGFLQVAELTVRTEDQPPRQAPQESACVPQERQELCRGRQRSSCGVVSSGCPGTTIICGCESGLSCEDGVCMPEHRACDPMSPRDVCTGSVCGKVSAGCPGAFVHCQCDNGLECEDGTCGGH
jgi:hypothetical protein